MKQITIYDLLPLLKKGWVAMDADGKWKNGTLEDGDYYAELAKSFFEKYGVEK